MHWKNRLSGPSEEKEMSPGSHCRLDHRLQDKEILDKETMIAHTSSKAIRDEKMQFPRLQENFADMEFKKMCSMMDR